MRNLLSFLINNSYWFVFIFLEAISFYFIFSDNSYQRSVFFNFSNELSGQVYKTSSNVTSYFGLREENVGLLQQNGDLMNRIAMLEDHIFELEKDSLRTRAFLDAKYEDKNTYIPARVVNNSVSLVRNYITINKGSKDNIEVGMGVVSHRGIVGEVRAVSSNFSIIQSVLNADSRYSCKLLGANAFGPLEWDGSNPRFATIKDYPSHEKVAVGDTVVTSGYSDIFPSDVMVGIIEGFEMQEDGSQYRLNVDLSTDFNSLTNVLVVKIDLLEEKRKLEDSVRNAKN